MPLRSATPWPTRQGVQSARPYPRPFTAHLPENQSACRLQLGLESEDLEHFFSADEFPLWCSLAGVQLPDTVLAFNNFFVEHDKKIDDFDRLVIFADGSSISHLGIKRPYFLTFKVYLTPGLSWGCVNSTRTRTLVSTWSVGNHNQSVQHPAISVMSPLEKPLDV